MLDTVLGMVWGAAALVFSQIVLAWVSPRWIEGVKQGAARKRFDAEPYVTVGQVFHRILRPGADREMCGLCYIHSLDTGRIEVRLLEMKLDKSVSPRPVGGYDAVLRETGEAMFWTLQEFEAYHPVVAVGRIYGGTK